MKPGPKPNPDLTSREADVLRYLAKGFTDRQIGVLIHRSVNTVHDYVKNIYRKLDVGSRAEAAVIAAKAGLV